MLKDEASHWKEFHVRAREWEEFLTRAVIFALLSHESSKAMVKDLQSIGMGGVVPRPL